MFDGTVVEIMREPNLPETPSNQVSRKYQFAAAGCAALVLALIVLISISRDTVKDERIFVRDVDARLFGTVSHQNRWKTLRDFFNNALHPQKTAMLVEKTYTCFAFTEDYHKIATRMEYLRRNKGERVFLITSCAENEGKSTTAANIALTLAGRGSRGLLLDLDFKKPAIHKIFEVEETDSPDLAQLIFGEDKAVGIPASFAEGYVGGSGGQQAEPSGLCGLDSFGVYRKDGERAVPSGTV